MTFTVIPALDLRGGTVVRLRQGDYAQETRFADDPLALAGRYADAGASWLHIVDLDGARRGHFANLASIEAIARAGTLRVQAGGGVRSMADIRRLTDAGVTRIVIGSMAVEGPASALAWLAELGAARLVLALDVRAAEGDWRLATHGWTTNAGAGLLPLLRRYLGAGAEHVLCTDIGRDGTLAGPSLKLYRTLLDNAPALRLQASGGVATLDDIRALRAAGAHAVILGRALLESRFTLAEALAC